MYYSPHTLWLRTDGTPSYDDKGNPVFAEGDYKQINVCRCDDTSVEEKTDDNGHVYRSTHKIVTEKPIEVKCGDFVRAMDGDKIRGEGKVRNIEKCNWYSYVTIWV